MADSIHMAGNASLVWNLPPLPIYTLTPRPPLLAPIPDSILSLISPVVAYWAVSMLFHFIDVNDYFPQYRLHTPAELLTKNRVTRWEVVRDVILQQIIQTVAGVAVTFFDAPEFVGKDDYNVAIWARRLRIAQRILPNLLALIGIDAQGLAKNLSRRGLPMLAGSVSGGFYPDVTQRLVLEDGSVITASAFTNWELSVASFMYWYLIPALQFCWAVSVLDTWQYFWHRTMHLNRWLYVTIHSRHHRLYVPYAFGALYNHPLEGFLLDTAGTGLAYLTACMSNRQAMVFFTFSTIKTVDDHCGYAFPWDPLQHVSSNNAAYHDIHHQSWGIKTNFSQPFFIFWDRILGTQWKGDVKLRYERSRVAAQQQLEKNWDLTSETDEVVQNEDAGSTFSAAFVSSDDPTDSNTRRRLRKRSIALETLKGSSHGVTTSVLQA